MVLPSPVSVQASSTLLNCLSAQQVDATARVQVLQQYAQSEDFAVLTAWFNSLFFLPMMLFAESQTEQNK